MTGVEVSGIAVLEVSGMTGVEMSGIAVLEVSGMTSVEMSLFFQRNVVGVKMGVPFTQHIYVKRVSKVQSRSSTSQLKLELILKFATRQRV
ncbi:hypothetical protein Bpfe_027158 [Biomphalaria pfeifferi]|uniref:Uncharacterized protein n=1 Tax=Biomphalaria pfeifferi TaxID=112525 RepID=A0AAD8AW08_BIOPF|nr:hypothetical protein Bpfe_027158 [Biomphalaria pfeifferi]